MTPEQLILAAALGPRNRYPRGLDDRLMADMGLTQEDVERQQRWFRRKTR